MTSFNTEIDFLKMYFGYPFEIGNGIEIKQPYIQDIIDYGEMDFWRMLSLFTTNSTTHRLELWDLGLDWNKISDYELFRLFYKQFTPEQTYIILGDLDLTKFESYIVNTGDESEEQDKEIITLYDIENDIEISEDIFNTMAFYIRTMFNMFPKVEKAKGKGTKEAIIWEERENLQRRENEDKHVSSILLPMISSCVNHPGFKYKKDELKNVGIYEFIDSCQRLQVYEASTALLKGMYSGFIDTKNINSKDYDFMRDIYSSRKSA